METLCVHTICSSHAPCDTCSSIVYFPTNLVSLVLLLVGNFSVSASEASGEYKIFCSKNVSGVFFCRKHLCLYSALAALNFIYSNQENCHMHANASYGFCYSRCYEAVIGD